MLVSCFLFLVSNDLVSIDIGGQLLNHHFSPSPQFSAYPMKATGLNPHWSSWISGGYRARFDVLQTRGIVE